MTHDTKNAEWLLAPILSERKPRLVELAGMIPHHFHPRKTDISSPTVQKLRNFIAECRQEYWAVKSLPQAQPGAQPLKGAKPRTARIRADHCEITAKECNEFLRSLPPVPFAGPDEEEG